MKLVLLSGGSGKRLWPLSNHSRSKQFLKMLQVSDHEWESMLQRIWRQIRSIGLADDAFISTSNSQVDAIHSQLGTQVPLILEPERRDTFPAIALAATYLYSRLNVDKEEVLTVMPVDSYVEHDFFEKLVQLEEVIRHSGANIALIGARPDYPAETYGYIIPDREAISQHRSWWNVLSFREKPPKEQAEQLIRQQALWNCGVFSFKLGYLLALLEERNVPIEYDALLQQYETLPAISFDYEVVEKAEQIVVIPYSGKWRDLGTWNSLTEEISPHLIGKGLVSEDCKNTHVINELDIPVAVLGVSDLVVAASPDGILVSSKTASHRLKEFARDMEQRPMFEERRWGWYRVLDYQTMPDGRELLTKRICIHAGKNLSYQYHHMRSEIWTIVAGEGEFVLDGRLIRVKSGDVLKIPVRAKHGIKALTELEIIEVQMGTKLTEDDIVRLFLSWEDTLRSL